MILKIDGSIKFDDSEMFLFKEEAKKQKLTREKLMDYLFRTIDFGGLSTQVGIAELFRILKITKSNHKERVIVE